MRYYERHPLILRKEARPPTEVMVVFVDRDKEQYGLRQSASKFRLPLRSTTSIKYENEALTDYPIASNEIKSLKTIYDVYRKTTSKSMVLTKYGGNCCAKEFALRAVQSNG